MPDDAVMGIMDSHLLRLRTNGSLNIKFASLIIDESSNGERPNRTAGKGSIMHGLNSSIVKDLVLALPPSPNKPQSSAFLTTPTAASALHPLQAEADRAAGRSRSRPSLHQAVTGQVDVRTGQPYTAYKPPASSGWGRADALGNAED